MSHAVPTQAVPGAPVVVHDHNTLLRALLTVATIAVVGLTIAVVILATDGDEATSRSSAGPTEATRYGGSNPAMVPDAAPMAGDSTPLQARKLDGSTDGPDEGTRGVLPSSSPYFDGGPDEGTRGPGH